LNESSFRSAEHLRCEKSSSTRAEFDSEIHGDFKTKETRRTSRSLSFLKTCPALFPASHTNSPGWS
jgi:hypothetical protein